MLVNVKYFESSAQMIQNKQKTRNSTPDIWLFIYRYIYSTDLFILYLRQHASSTFINRYKQNKVNPMDGNSYSVVVLYSNQRMHGTRSTNNTLQTYIHRLKQLTPSQISDNHHPLQMKSSRRFEKLAQTSRNYFLEIVVG